MLDTPSISRSPIFTETAKQASQPSPLKSPSQKRSKILYLNGGYPFCYYYRGFLPGVYSNQAVFKDFIVGLKPSPEEITAKARQADIIVFQRPTSRQMFELAQLLKAENKKIIFENDDTYKVGKGIELHRLENDKQRAMAIEMHRYTNLFLGIADGVVASTEFLAKEYAEINPNVAVLKNCIDPLDEIPCKVNDTGKFRIGFLASVSTNDDYVHIKDQIRQLDERGDITIVVQGIKYPDGSMPSAVKQDFEFWNSLKNVEWHPYVPIHEYMLSLANLALDLCVIPRKDNYFNRCKSNLKFLEMSLLKIPVIAQGFEDGLSPYQQDVGYLSIVSNSARWYSLIIEIKEDYPRFAELAKNAHDYVLRNYNIEHYAEEWTNKIINLCKSQPSF